MVKKVEKGAPRKTAPRKRQTYRRTAKRNFVRVSGRSWRDGKITGQFQIPTWVLVAALILAVVLFAPPDLSAKLSAALMQVFDWMAKKP